MRGFYPSWPCPLPCRVTYRLTCHECGMLIEQEHDVDIPGSSVPPPWIPEGWISIEGAATMLLCPEHPPIIAAKGLVAARRNS